MVRISSGHGGLKLVAIVFCAAVVLLATTTGYSQRPGECSRTAHATQAMELVDRAPAYSTRSGWTYGTSIATIPQGARMQICEERTVGFFGAKQRWLRIRWDGKEGWSLGEHVKEGQLQLFRRLRAFLIPNAYAQAAPPTTGLHLSDPLVTGSFISILLGMLAKNIFDLFIKVEAVLSKKIVLRVFLPLVVSPIAFLSFIKSADFTIQDELGMLVVFLFAFQNGFFWQDILAKPPAGK
jgi:hypothetical protein